MLKVKEREIRKIKKDIEKGFPYDFPLQQIHIARKIINMEAEKRGLSFIQFIKSEFYDPLKGD